MSKFNCRHLKTLRGTLRMCPTKRFFISRNAWEPRIAEVRGLFI